MSDVATIPDNGTWFQQISNGTITINNGPNGLQKLDKVIELAQKHGIYVLLSLTNNWNPLSGDPLAGSPEQQSTNSSLPRNTLSNDYGMVPLIYPDQKPHLQLGGMDFYVRQLTATHEHDQFYTNQMIIDAFKNYTTQVISRYVNSPSVFAWYTCISSNYSSDSYPYCSSGN